MDFIFGNIGKKIKILALIFFVLELIGGAITGLVMLFGDVIIGLIIIVATPFAAFLSVFMLYAFGELIEKTTENESNTREILEIMKQSNAEPINDNPKAPQVQNEKTTQTTFINDIASQTIICSACGTRQPSNRKVCWHCGASFISEAPNDNT